MGSQAMPSHPFPIIDFTKEELMLGTNTWLLARNEVKHAFEKDGFFVALYGKVPTELSASVFSALEELFDLPTESKIQNTSSIPYFGYIGPSSIKPHFESLGIEDATVLDRVENFSKLMWPSGNHRFCESYTKILSGLDKMLSRMVFESYGVEKHYDSYVKSVFSLLRVQKYKAPDHKDETNIGAPAHFDKNFITILDQNQVKGLEVKTKDGNWIAVEFPPSSFVVMAGEALLAWSNGRIQPALHRVMITGNKDRYSIGLFGYHKGIVRVPEELVDAQHPLHFKPFDHLAFLRFHSTYDGPRSENSIKVYCGI